MQIETVAQISKRTEVGITRKDDHRVFATLKVTDLFLTPEQADWVMGQPDGHTRAFVLDELGAPRFAFKMALKLGGLELALVGTIGDPEKQDRLRLLDATIGNMEARVTNLGVILSGTLEWPAAGDEACDTQPLFGKMCSIRWRFTHRQQELPLAA
jgi:hypothetical protein